MNCALSVVVPCLDEATAIADTLACLAPLRARGAEVIVVDGGSRDGTAEIARPLCDRCVVAPRGRASQMNAGAGAAAGDVLLFLHADSLLPPYADRLVVEAVAGRPHAWGRFDVAISGRHHLLPVIAWFMNQRSALTGIATGDQGIFVTRALFDQAGGFPEIALMEDIALSAKLRAHAPPLRVRERIVTSGRRWERNGVVSTVLLMWWLRLQYRFGADPARLAQRYGRR